VTAMGVAGFPGWRVWEGVAGLWYARLPGSSPPLVARAASPAGLPAAIRGALAERAALRAQPQPGG
jgi:hypothetical protein